MTQCQPIQKYFLYSKRKKPTESANFFPLKGIKEEAEYQIDLIQQNKRGMRAKIFDIKDAADMQTYKDILQALKQRSPDSADLSTLNNILFAAEEQIKQVPKLVQEKPIIQPQPQPKELPQEEYTQILNQLKVLQPSTNDWDALRKIKDEVVEQMNKAFNPALAKKSQPGQK